MLCYNILDVEGSAVAMQMTAAVAMQMTACVWVGAEDDSSCLMEFWEPKWPVMEMLTLQPLPKFPADLFLDFRLTFLTILLPPRSQTGQMK